MHIELDSTERPFTVTSTPPTDFPSAISSHDSATEDHSYIFTFVHSDSNIVANGTKSPDAIQQSLRTIVPNSTASAYVAHNWKLDPFSKGAWGAYGTENARK